MSKAATEGSLGELHNKVARVMTKALEAVEAAQDQAGDDIDGIAPYVNPALLSVITRFLNENKITCVPEKTNEMGALEKTLKDKRQRRGNVVSISGIPHDDVQTG